MIDYTRLDFADAVSDVDVVLDPIGGDAASRSLEVLRPGGRLVTAVADDDADLAARYEAAGRHVSGIAVDPDPVALRGLVDLVNRDQLRVHIQQTFRFEQVIAAHQLMDAGHLEGKLVLSV